MNVDAARDKMRKRLGRKRFPPEAASEVVMGIYPMESSKFPLRPVTGDPRAAAAFVNSFGFNRSKMEELWRLLWGMSTDAYYTPTPAVPPVGDDEKVLTAPQIMPRYPTACWASTSGMLGKADRCRGTGEPPLYPKTHNVMGITSGVWVCWDCFERQTDQPDLDHMEQFNRGEIDLVAGIRDPFRQVRLSELHGR